MLAKEQPRQCEEEKLFFQLITLFFSLVKNGKVGRRVKSIRKREIKFVLSIELAVYLVVPETLMILVLDRT